ncbi:MAG: ABC transporter ATP-binding protein [Spirochaetes bacterium]|nr:ABC transporter ATP-binding protein [Spirochaetota bacterium]
MNDIILNVKNLSCGYNSKIILKNINFEINKDDFVGIIGPNGSGKTTLFRAINKIIKVQKGEIILFNKHLEHYNRTEIARIVSVASMSNYNIDIKVEDFILLGRLPHYKSMQIFESKEDHDIVFKIMEMTDISKYNNRYLDELSSGERQLVVIAKALAQEPKLLLLDEPIAHLDITHQLKILDLLKKLNKQLDLTIIVILHDINIASEYCNKIIILNKGEIYSAGTPSDILNKKAVKDVYNVEAVIDKNPLSNKPFIFFNSSERL